MMLEWLNRVTRADRRAWGGPTTLAGVGEVTARWLEGTVPTWEGYGRGPDPETGPLVPVLARLNRAGFVTHGSQPGVVDGPWRQRAWVDGFADDATLGVIRAAVAGSPLVLRYGKRRAHRKYRRYPITTWDGRVETSVTCGAPWSELSLAYADCSADAYRALRDAWRVTVIDPEWGRDDLLWTRLDSKLRPPHTPVSFRGEAG